jgi:hypothetical protein
MLKLRKYFMNIIQYSHWQKIVTKLKCVDAEFKDTYNLIKIMPSEFTILLKTTN